MKLLPICPTPQKNSASYFQFAYLYELKVIVYYFQSKTEVVKLPHLAWCGLSYYQPREAKRNVASRGW